jgi:hypothetical protein
MVLLPSLSNFCYFESPLVAFLAASGDFFWIEKEYSLKASTAPIIFIRASGWHQIEFTYEPVGLKIGIIISGVTTILLLFLYFKLVRTKQ